MTMDETTRQVLARNVRALRKRAGLSQTQLGERCGLGQTTISYIERQAGEKSPTVETLAAVARVLRVPVWTLLVPMGDAGADAARRVDALVASYVHLGEQGRAVVEHIAEAEARYQVTTDKGER